MQKVHPDLLSGAFEIHINAWVEEHGTEQGNQPILDSENGYDHHPSLDGDTTQPVGAVQPNKSANNPLGTGDKGGIVGFPDSGIPLMKESDQSDPNHPLEPGNKGSHQADSRLPTRQVGKESSVRGMVTASGDKTSN